MRLKGGIRRVDSTGRITIGKDLAKKYGRRFFVVHEPDRIRLIPMRRRKEKEIVKPLVAPTYSLE